MSTTMTTAPDMTSRGADVGQRYSPRQIRAVMVSLMLGMLLAALDQTINRTVKHVSSTLSGLWLHPLTVGLLATSIASGRLVSRFGRYKLYVVAGTAVVTIGVALLTMIQVGTSELALSGILFVLGCGLGLIVQLTVLAAQNAGTVLIAQESSRLPQDVRTYGSAQGSLHAFPPRSRPPTCALCPCPSSRWLSRFSCARHHWMRAWDPLPSIRPSPGEK
jgi:hypothetical protein